MMKNGIEIKMMDPKILFNNIATPAKTIPITMSDRDMINLQESINTVGQLNPVIIYKGKMYDGRHRCIACARNNMEVKAAFYDDAIYSEEQILLLIAADEDQGKKLNSAQKAIKALENYVIKSKYSIIKASKIVNVSDRDISAIKNIKEHPYAVSHNFYDTLAKGGSVKLPVSKKYSKSPRVISRELDEYDKINSNKNDNDLIVFGEQTIDYDLAFIEYDFENRCRDLFWEAKNEFNINTYEESCKFIFMMLKSVYNDKYDFERELTIDKIKKICKIM